MGLRDQFSNKHFRPLNHQQRTPREFISHDIFSSSHLSRFLSLCCTLKQWNSQPASRRVFNTCPCLSSGQISVERLLKGFDHERVNLLKKRWTYLMWRQAMMMACAQGSDSKVEDLGGLLDGMTYVVIFDGLYRDELVDVGVSIKRIEGKGVKLN